MSHDNRPPWDRPSLPRTLQAAHVAGEVTGAALGRIQAHATLAELGAPAGVIEASRAGLLRVLPGCREALMVLDRVLIEGEVPRALDPVEMLPPAERGILARVGLGPSKKPTNPHFSSALEALSDTKSPGRYGFGFGRRDGKR